MALVSDMIHDDSERRLKFDPWLTCRFATLLINFSVMFVSILKLTQVHPMAISASCDLIDRSIQQCLPYDKLMAIFIFSCSACGFFILFLIIHQKLLLVSILELFFG